ncbi:MAG TPA: RNA-binding protein [Clostridiales bacterium]|nr:RNA-binding protein [Clostridiales bacterium]HBJ97540.1 RNA-binding protein [Clostridiales bacterium]
MLDMIKYIVEQFAEKKDEIEYLVEENQEENTVNVTIVLASSDMGKVIGRQGKIAKALRTLVKTKASETKQKYNIEIKEKGETF